MNTDKRNHLILISGWFSSWFGRYRKWARMLEKRFKTHYGNRVGKDIIIWEVSSDGSGEKPAIQAVLNDFRTGKLGKVMIAGHSNGGGELDIASQMFYAKGIDVEYAATIDRTLGYGGYELYGSVKYFDEFWAGLRRTKFDESFKGTKNFYDLDKQSMRNIDHVESASLKFVQDKIFNETVKRIV